MLFGRKKKKKKDIETDVDKTVKKMKKRTRSFRDIGATIDAQYERAKKKKKK